MCRQPAVVGKRFPQLAGGHKAERPVRRIGGLAMETRVTRLLGIEKPVLQGGMAWVSEGRLAAAVSNAGGLGIIACGAAQPEWVEEQVKLARSLTDKPIGCNVMMMSPYVAQIAPMLAELKVDVITTGAGSPSDYIPIWLSLIHISEPTRLA